MTFTKTQKRRMRKLRAMMKYSNQTQGTENLENSSDKGSISNNHQNERDGACTTNDTSVKEYHFTRKVNWTVDDIHPKLLKYWHQRYSLFEKFDQGIKIDEQGWYSVTPWKIANHHAARFSHCSVVVDAFCGVGGNTIEFAKVVDFVIAVDIDKERLEIAKWNAFIYGVHEKIKFIHGDFMEMGETLTADGIFLSPPWGGTNYLTNEFFDINTMTTNG
jgi:predicted methyltransferase